MMAVAEAKKKVIVIRGQRAPADTFSPHIDFAEYAKNGEFERILGEMQSGHIPMTRMVLSDKEGNGLRVIIRRTGSIAYHCHYFAPEPPDNRETDEDDAARPLLKIGTYPKTPVRTVRERAATITKLAEMGINVRWGLDDRLMKELDERGIKWKP